MGCGLANQHPPVTLTKVLGVASVKKKGYKTSPIKRSHPQTRILKSIKNFWHRIKRVDPQPRILKSIKKFFGTDLQNNEGIKSV